jgi:hypothetical protein
MQCTNNFKQIALAAHNYIPAHGCLPPGTAIHALAAHPDWGMSPSNGLFLPLSLYLEQRAVFDAVNFAFNVFDEPNATVHAVGIPTLRCPSDPIIAQAMTVPAGDPDNWWGPHPLTLGYTSYCGNQGPWWL